jgi:hypothetical protein
MFINFLDSTRLRALALWDEEGSLESALVLIPLMILVLSALQIALGILNRDVVGGGVQSSINQSALYSPTGLSPLATLQSEGLAQVSALPLAGGGYLYVGERELNSPSLTPLLPGGDKFSFTGIAIGEGR